MGVITDTGKELLEPMDIYSIQPAATDYWNDIVNIAQLVQSSYYDLWYPIRNMGLALSDETAAIAIKLDHTLIDVRLQGILDPVYEQLGNVLHLYGNFWNFVVDTLGFVYNSANSRYELIANGFVNRTKVRLTNLEAKGDPFTDTEMQKLSWLIDHYDDFNKLINDDINYVINEVMGKIEPLVYDTVERAIAPFDSRLQAVEGALGKTQFWFWDLILDVWAFLAGGSILPIGQIEDTMKVIGEWFIDEIYAITEPIEFSIGLLEMNLTDRILDIEEDYNTMLFSYAEHLIGHFNETKEIVDAAIEAALIGIGGGTGEKGEKGEPGQRGEKGEPGAPGEPGAVGDVNINNINNELYIKLWNAGAITTNTFTGVVDWMLEVYGLRFADIQEQLTPITEFFTDETKLALTELVDKFGTPEAIISFLIPESEGQEGEVLDLMQILISMTFEREN